MIWVPGRHRERLSRKRYEHVRVRLTQSIHGLRHSGKAVPDTALSGFRDIALFMSSPTRSEESL